MDCFIFYTSHYIFQMDYYTIRYEHLAYLSSFYFKIDFIHGKCTDDNRASTVTRIFRQQNYCRDFCRDKSICTVLDDLRLDIVKRHLFCFMWLFQRLFVNLEESYNHLKYSRFGEMAEIWVTNWQPCLFLRFAASCLT